MEPFLRLLNLSICGNTLEAYLRALVFFIGIILLFQLLDRLLFRRLKAWAKQTVNKTDDFMVAACEKYLVPLLRFAAFFFALKPLTLPHYLDKFITYLAVIVLTIQGTRLVLAVLTYIIETNLDREKEKHKVWNAVRNILGVLRIFVWGFAIVFAMDNLGFNVSAVVAGLGIGGVAVALAGQTILGDLFNYFVVCFDKPFEHGDFITIGDYKGEVENIGIKTTRLRSLTGEQLIFSNSDLTGSRVRNYKRMEKRRVEFKFGIAYETPLEKVAKVSSMVEDIIKIIPKTKLEHVHFNEFGDSSLIFEAVYFILGPDYNEYKDVQEQINLKIMETFQKESIEFAYPTQKLYLENANSKL